MVESKSIMYSGSSDYLEAQRALESLHRRFAIFAVASFLTLGSVYQLLSIFWEPRFAITWGVTAILGLFYLLWVFFRNLQKNHRPGESHLLPRLGPGNTLTLLRGVLLAFLSGFLFLPTPANSLIWAPGLIFTLAIAADFFDGYLARISNHVTRLGEALDMSLDGIGLLIAILLAIQYGQLPPWYLSVALARYLFLGGMHLRTKLGYPNHELRPSVRRRAFAGLQMGFVSVMLWPVFTPPGTYVAALVFSIPFLGGFLLDWLAGIGIANSASGGRYANARWMVANAVPLVLRFILLTGLVIFSGERYLHYSIRISSYVAFDIFPAVSFGLFLFALETLVMCSLVLGAAGRLASIAGLLLLGVDQIFGTLQPAQYLLIFIYISTIYLGTGPYSLWKPEDRLISRQAGAARGVSGAKSTAPSGD